MIKVGITGGIGSGKTTFCKQWEEGGVFVLYADDFAKQLMASDPKLIECIKNEFGEQSYHTDGTLNRSYLAKEAFEKNKVEKLNEIVHPVLFNEAEKLFKKKADEGAGVVAKEAAILLSNGRPKELDYVIIITANEKDRIKRTLKRDNVQESEVVGRITKQPNFNELFHLADFVVLNDGTEEDLRKKADQILQHIRSGEEP